MRGETSGAKNMSASAVNWKISQLVVGLLSALFLSAASAQSPWPDQAPDGWGLAIIDVETTGLDPGHHEMIDLGAIYTTLDGEVIDRFFVRIMPEYPDRASEQARAINGFSVERWQWLEAVSTASAVEAFKTFHDARSGQRRFILTAYNAPFDRSFLAELLERHGYAFDDFFAYFVLDLPSMAFAAGATALQNDRVAEHFGLPPETDDPIEHTGLSGAQWNLSLYRALLEKGHGPKMD